MYILIPNAQTTEKAVGRVICYMPRHSSVPAFVITTPLTYLLVVKYFIFLCDAVRREIWHLLGTNRQCPEAACMSAKNTLHYHTQIIVHQSCKRSINSHYLYLYLSDLASRKEVWSSLRRVFILFLLNCALYISLF